VSLRLQLIKVARRAPGLLGESTGLVREFYRRQFDANGVAHDRAGHPDLYYAIFALAGAQALNVPVPADQTQAWLATYGDGDGLDLVHLGALARCWAALGTERMPDGLGEVLLRRIERFRKPDGGCDGDPKRPHGTAYGAFVALGAFQDLGQAPPRPMALVRSLKGLETADGVWSNSPGAPAGALNATAGAVVLLRQLGLAVPAAAGDWLLAQGHLQGGFVAVPGAPMPDLLSTATALHALACLDRRLPSRIHERCLDFVDTLWCASGGFHGHWADDRIDAEYTFYGLLALGHLGA